MSGNRIIRRFNVEPLRESTTGPFMMWETHRELMKTVIDLMKRSYEAGKAEAILKSKN